MTEHLHIVVLIVSGKTYIFQFHSAELAREDFIQSCLDGYSGAYRDGNDYLNNCYFRGKSDGDKNS